MSSPSLAVEKEDCKVGEASGNEEIPEARNVSNSEEAEAKEDDVHYLTGKPFFDVILAASHVNNPYLIHIPSSFVRALPHANVAVVLRHGGKNWNMSYIGDTKQPRFDPKWKTFVTENHLKIGDACVFELMDHSNTNLRFKVHLLRSDLPPELLISVDSRGKAPNTPINLD